MGSEMCIRDSFAHLRYPSASLTSDVEVVRVSEDVARIRICASTWNLSGILDHVVESWAHLRPSFPRLPYDLVGVVAERYPDALLVGSVVCDDAYTPLNFFTLPEVFFVNLYQDAEQVLLVLVISQ